jgi:hypothetical protein
MGKLKVEQKGQKMIQEMSLDMTGKRIRTPGE